MRYLAQLSNGRGASSSIQKRLFALCGEMFCDKG